MSKKQRTGLIVAAFVAVVMVTVACDDPPAVTPIATAVPTLAPTATPVSIIPEAAGEEIVETAGGIGEAFQKVIEWNNAGSDTSE